MICKIPNKEIDFYTFTTILKRIKLFIILIFFIYNIYNRPTIIIIDYKTITYFIKILVRNSPYPFERCYCKEQSSSANELRTK